MYLIINASIDLNIKYIADEMFPKQETMILKKHEK